MKIVRVLAAAGAVLAGSMSLAGAPASAAPVQNDLLAVAAGMGDAQVSYARHRYYRVRHYAPRRVYVRRVYRPYRVYRPHRAYRRYVYRPRVVCRVRHTYWGARRVVCRRRY